MDASGVHHVPEAVVREAVLRQRVGGWPFSAGIADLEEADVGVVDDVLGQHVVVLPVRVVNPEKARRVAFGCGQSVEFVLGLAQGFCDGGAMRPFDEVGLRGAGDELILADVVHVDVAPDVLVVVGTDGDFASGHDEEPAGVVEAFGDLGESLHADLRPAILRRAPLGVGEGGLVGLEHRGFKGFWRPDADLGRGDLDPAVGVGSDAVVVGDGEEIVAGVAIGDHGLLGQGAAVRPARVRVQHPSEKTRSGLCACGGCRKRKGNENWRMENGKTRMGFHQRMISVKASGVSVLMSGWRNSAGARAPALTRRSSIQPVKPLPTTMEPSSIAAVASQARPAGVARS